MINKKNGPQANFRLGRLPVQPERGQGQICPKTLAYLNCKIQELLPGLTYPVQQLMPLIGLLTSIEKEGYWNR